MTASAPALMGGLAVAAGGGIGAVMRHAMGAAIARHAGIGFPYGTLAVNVLGCLAIGLLAGWFAMREPVDPVVRLFLATGVLGGFTTFSAFSLESIMLFERRPFLGGVYIAASLVLCLAACWAGLRAMRGM